MENSKTPQFDALLQPILDALVPHSKDCAWKGKHQYCEGNFEITAEDIEFLRMLRATPSKYCPTCRRIRRMVYMNMSRLFKRQCDVPGHKEQMISILTPECPFPVYDYEYFIGDQFDAFSFGTDWKSGESPMETLFNLRKIFPMPSFLNRDPSSINSEYSNGGRDNKNIYYAMGCYGTEDVWYSSMIDKSKEVMDSTDVNGCDGIYYGLSANTSYKCSFTYYSRDCSDSMYIFDCRNCSDCFGCVNLRNKRYCIWNEQVTKEEYAAFMRSVKPFSHSFIKESEEKFWQLVASQPMNASQNIAVENVSGTLCDHCKNAFDVTHCVNAENVRHADGALGHRDSMDLLFSGGSERVYQTINIGSRSSNVKFSVSSKFTTDSEYVFNSKNISNCFMCFGLQNKSYCILNKQYSSEEYWPMVDAIKTDMLVRGEWGESPDMRFSAQAYNFSSAGINFPLTEAEVRELGGFVASEPETNSSGMDSIEAHALPETIAEVDDSILTKGIICEKTGRPFRIIATELAFYRKTGLPLPHIHPNYRMQARSEFISDGKKYAAQCENCSKAISSVFPIEKGFRLYCEKCHSELYN